ncbi:MAG: sulfatase-like hydrolase/transferase [Planctomycetota bacterium]
MPTTRPNILIFFVDQQRHDTTGVHGCPLSLTPTFDRLARAGTDIHRSFTCQPVCGPARACLQTGTHATTHGSVTNTIGLTPELPLLADQFRNAGYHTGYLGKWHLARENTLGPVPPDQRGGYNYWLAANALEMTSDAYRTRLWDTDNQPHDLPGYRVDALTDALIRHLDDRIVNHDDQPWFTMCSYLEPHHQNHVDDYPPPDGYREPYAGRWCPPDLAALPSQAADEALTGGSTHAHLAGYCGMIKRLDEALGRVVDVLKSRGVLENTVILYTSDHGCHFKTRNDEYKRSGHEASIRVPTMLYGGPFTGGGRIDSLISLVDLPATLLDAAGIAPPPTFEGRSLLPLVRRDAEALAAWPDDMYVQISERCWGRAVRSRRWKYILRDFSRDELGHQDYNGTHDSLTETELYDLQHDPHELTNLVALDSHARVREVMRTRLRRRMETLHEPAPQIIEPSETLSGGQRVVTEAEAWL